MMTQLEIALVLFVFVVGYIVGYLKGINEK
jgi:hypothetical protein